MHVELRRPHVTLMLLWLEHRRSRTPTRTASSAATTVVAAHLDVVMRQEHRAGEKLFVDFPGRRIPIYDRTDGS